MTILAFCEKAHDRLETVRSITRPCLWASQRRHSEGRGLLTRATCQPPHSQARRRTRAPLATGPSFAWVIAPLQEGGAATI